MDERERDDVERMFEPDAVRPDGPLFEALMASLDRSPLPVDPRVADAAAGRLSRRLGARASWVRAPWPLVVAGLGLAAAAAMAAAVTAGLGSGDPSPTGPPEDVVSDGIVAAEAPVAAEATRPAASPEVVQIVRDLMAAGDWLGAWRAAAGVGLSEEDLRALASGLHRAGHASKDPETMEAASTAYEAYLTAFPAGPADAEMRWAYGELLFGQERFPEAYEQYVTVVDRHPESRHAKFCAESALFAAERLADPEDGTVDVWEERVVDAADLFVGLWPDDPKGLAMNYRAGYLLLGAGRAEDAVPYFVAVISAAPESREAAFAADLLVGAWGEDAVGRATAAAAAALAEDRVDVLEAFADALEEAGRDDDADAVRGAP